MNKGTRIFNYIATGYSWIYKKKKKYEREENKKEKGDVVTKIDT